MLVAWRLFPLGLYVTNIWNEPTLPSLTERNADKICTVFSCYDRIIIQGALPGLYYAKGMTNYLCLSSMG